MPDDLFDAEFLKKLELLRVVARRIPAGEPGGGRTGRRTGPGLEFAEHRAYVAGDDFRHLDWAAFARLEKLLLRLCQGEEDLAVTFLIDASASMATGRPPKFDHARRLAAALAYVGLAGLEEVRLVAIAEGGVRAHLEAGRGRAHLAPVLDWLRALRPEGATDLARSVAATLPHARRAGLAVLISDLLDPAGHEAPMQALASRGFDLWCLHVTDPTDHAPDALGDLAVEDAETGESMGVHVTPPIRDRLEAQARGWIEEVRTWCLERSISHAEAPTSAPVETLVMDVLRRGGLLR